MCAHIPTDYWNDAGPQPPDAIAFVPDKAQSSLNNAQGQQTVQERLSFAFFRIYFTKALRTAEPSTTPYKRAAPPRILTANGVSGTIHASQERRRLGRSRIPDHILPIPVGSITTSPVREIALRHMALIHESPKLLAHSYRPRVVCRKMPFCAIKIVSQRKKQQSAEA